MRCRAIAARAIRTGAHRSATDSGLAFEQVTRLTQSRWHALTPDDEAAALAGPLASLFDTVATGWLPSAVRRWQTDGRLALGALGLARRSA